jgi:hypothetical protein
LPTLRIPILHFEGTLECFASNGLMVFFNDPLPRLDLVARAVHIEADAYAMA